MKTQRPGLSRAVLRLSIITMFLIFASGGIIYRREITYVVAGTGIDPYAVLLFILLIVLFIIKVVI